jgi:hypothetical protein
MCTLSAAMMSNRLSVVKLIPVTLNVIKLSVIMLNVVASKIKTNTNIDSWKH